VIPAFGSEVLIISFGIIVLNYGITWLILRRKKDGRGGNGWFLLFTAFVALAGLGYLAFSGLQGFPRVTFGKEPGQVLLESRCLRCHRLGDKGADFAPDLLKLKVRYGSREQLRAFLEEPARIASGMPRQNLTFGELEEISSALWQEWTKVLVDGETHDGQAPMPRRQEDSNRRWARGSGLKIMRAKGCFECHSLGSQGGSMGPRLDYIGTDRDAAWFKSFLQNPAVQNPQGTMPKLGLTPEEIEAVGEFLAELK